MIAMIFLFNHPILYFCSGFTISEGNRQFFRRQHTGITGGLFPD